MILKPWMSFLPVGFTVYMRSQEYPTLRQFDYRTVLEPHNRTDGVYTICFPDNAILKTGHMSI